MAYTGIFGLCKCFYLAKWKVIGFGEKEGDKMIFRNLGRDVVYLLGSLKLNDSQYLPLLN